MISETVRTNLLNNLNAERRKYGPTMTNTECVQLLNAAAAKTGNGAGLLPKPSGNNGTIPGLVKVVDGQTVAAFVSVDFIVFSPNGEGWDVLADAGGASTVTGSIGPTPSEVFAPDRWMAPVAVQDGPGPAPTPVPVPTPVPTPAPPVDLAGVMAALKETNDRLTRIEKLFVAHAEGQKVILEHVDADRNVDIGIKFLGTASGRVKAFGEK